jgi:hypothetical protein
LVRVASNKSSITTLGVESFAALGISGVNSSNLAAVLSQISAGSNGVAGVESLRSIVNQYAASVAPETPPAPVVPKPPVVLPPVVTPPVAKPTPPVSVVFSAGSTTLSAQAKAQISTKVVQLLKAGSKSLVITSKVTLVKNASKAWTNTVMTAAKARAAAVNKVVRAKLAALGIKTPVVVKVVTTTANGVRQVQIQGK